MHSVFSRLLRKFPESAHTLRRTQTLTTVGLFLAIQMVLSSYGTIQVNDSLKISLAHLALAPTAMLFGPVAAALQGAMSDILGFLLKPTGPYFPGFTISAALGGVIYGLFLFESDRKLWQIVLARAVIMVLVNIMLNTLFLTMLYGPSQAALLPVRALKNAMQFPIDCLLLTAVSRTTLPALTLPLLIPTGVFAALLGAAAVGWHREGVWQQQGQLLLCRQHRFHLHQLCVFHPDTGFTALQSPWAVTVQRANLTLVFPGKEKVTVRSVPLAALDFLGI